VKRREFITGLAGAAAWPLAAHAQRGERMRRIGVLALSTEDDFNNRKFVALLRENLAAAGWTEGRNLRLDFRFGASSNLLQAGAVQLVELGPDVIISYSAAATRALQHETQIVPIVFVYVGDPVTQGIVKSVARHESNTTGFTNLFTSIAGKCAGLLKNAAPSIARIATVFNPEVYVFKDYLAEIERGATAAAVQVIRTPVTNAGEIERAIGSFAREPNGALMFVPPPLALANRQLAIQLAVRYSLPSIYPGTTFTTEGGLMAYGSSMDDLVHGASSYVDRILRGTKVGDLPVQFPTKFQLSVNLNTAKAIGLTLSPSFLLLADEVIE
jgi:putative tryptophan/tyrosine transport system substrate-binding protein